MSPRTLFGLVFCLLIAGSGEAFAEFTSVATPLEEITQAEAALERGAFDEAIDRLELAADRGVVHPDVSYARARAYVERARSSAARAGDLGRAAAALEETLHLRPSDDTAEKALEKIRAEISRRRARTGASPVIQRPAIGRAVADLLPENVWAGVAAFGALVLTLGLSARHVLRRRTIEIAAAVGVVAGLVFGVVGGALAGLSRYYRTTSRPAVVVVAEARLLDADGRPLPRRGESENAVPEGALVHVRGQADGLSDIEWGTVRGFVSSAQVRLLASP
ncbi:MAG TPA: hypothetical protein VKY73_21240 [Polyangiaceae bacterium]|nr:hypothetical protein [Polyangiaceae bacterium]